MILVAWLPRVMSFLEPLTGAKDMTNSYDSTAIFHVFCQNTLLTRLLTSHFEPELASFSGDHSKHCHGTRYIRRFDVFIMRVLNNNGNFFFPSQD